MRRLYCAILLALFVIASTAAGITWKRIRLESAGTISLPHEWNIIGENSAVIQNAYGQGVSCRTLLNAQIPNASMSVLLYWPYAGDNARKFASDMAGTLMLRYGSQSRPTESEMKIGTIRASTVTYRIDRENDQKVTAFIHGGKIHCVITTYSHAEEYRFSRLIRGILSRWQF